MSKPANFPPVTISTNDYDRLAWIATAGMMSRRAPPVAEMLADELVRATVVAANAVPPSVVTMHSRVEFRDETTGQTSRLTLVYPGEDDGDTGLISVLTPIGTALIGLSEGQSIRWRTATGEWKTLTVLRVLYQPQRMALHGIPEPCATLNSG
ncbi:nucleoside diphosphate kinase regulator [Microvirga massiliensis]|uniref:nucleoside diphosphate kinase regulator n=1 Tax=Microvirga massiliensis TaxID=1033741 RepID=UPI00062BB49B|nr:nucleoside diphosphate kinase regulator [Microvirga massiliensis]